MQQTADCWLADACHFGELGLCQAGLLDVSFQFHGANKYTGRILDARGDGVNFWDMAQPRKIYIREWRKYRGLTLVRLAERVGMSQPSLSRIERGDQPYSQPVLEALADALSCEPADLIGRLPGAPSELTLLINRVTPEQLETVTTVLRALITKAA